MKNYLTRILFFVLTITLINCQKEEIINSNQLEVESQYIPRLATIPIKQTLNFLKTIETNSFAREELLLDVDDESTRQEEITNTDAKITLTDTKITNPDGTIAYEDMESIIMRIEIEGTEQTVLYNVISDETSTSELVVITDLEGVVYNVFDFSNGEILGEVDLNNYSSTDSSSGDDGDGICWGITCGIDLDEVYITNGTTIPNWAYINYGNTTNTMMTYQFVRSTNNYSSLGTAYANYYDNSQTQNPCPNDPVPNLEVAPQTISGIEGGLFGNESSGGCPRTGGNDCTTPKNKKHEGLDLVSNYGDPIYAMYGGTASTHEFSDAGNLVFIQSVINGQSISIQYFHLQDENRATGTVQAGDIIGYQGVSGNLLGAIVKKKAVSHVHIKMKDANGIPIDPRGYLGTVIDDNGNITENTNCN